MLSALPPDLHEDDDGDDGVTDGEDAPEHAHRLAVPHELVRVVVGRLPVLQIGLHPKLHNSETIYCWSNSGTSLGTSDRPPSCTSQVTTLKQYIVGVVVGCLPVLQIGLHPALHKSETIHYLSSSGMSPSTSDQPLSCTSQVTTLKQYLVEL